uniref:Hydroxysteroid (20-beta) dehydrogenase 2 n=2 Tax=Cynoglossus semilaevis TaxID=244447 RepID=A0A3P8WJ18_CYNSE
MSVVELLTITGGLVVLYHLLALAWKCWRGLRQFVFSKFWQVDLKAYGKWAVVTGATAGIGRAYALELARRGLDVVLVSRSADKLQGVAKEIEETYGRNTCTIQVDFTEGHSIYSTIAAGLEGLEIGILVNNVGMLPCAEFAAFMEAPDIEQKSTHLVNCNILSVVQMSRLVLPAMIQRRRGLIINISSISGDHPYPFLSLYSASKTFVTVFSRCLNAEYQPLGITVQSVNPSLISTNMVKHMEVGHFVKSAPEFAVGALNTVGHSDYTNGCLAHALMDTALRILQPEWLRLSQFNLRRLRNYNLLAKKKRSITKQK